MGKFLHNFFIQCTYRIYRENWQKRPWPVETNENVKKEEEKRKKERRTRTKKFHSKMVSQNQKISLQNGQSNFSIFNWNFLCFFSSSSSSSYSFVSLGTDHFIFVMVICFSLYFLHFRIKFPLEKRKRSIIFFKLKSLF